MRTFSRFSAAGKFSIVFAALVVLAGLAGRAQAADLRESWSFYIAQVKKKASVEQREEMLNRILNTYKGQDMDFVKKELHRVRTDVSFNESMRYYDAQLKRGIPKEKKIAYLKGIISKYEARGMDMSRVRTMLDKVKTPPSTPKSQATARVGGPAGLSKKTITSKKEPALVKDDFGSPEADPDPEDVPVLPPVESYKSISLLAGMHMYPGSSYFDTNSTQFASSDFTSPAFVLGYRQRFSQYGWGAEFGQYGKSNSYTAAIAGTTNTVSGSTELGTMFIRFGANYHFIHEERPWDASLGFGVGPYFWKKKTADSIDTSPATAVNADTSGMIIGFHLGARISYKFSPTMEIFLEDSYAFASESDSQKIKSASKDDAINFGGHLIGIGLSYRWWQ